MAQADRYLMRTYGRFPLALVRGAGAYVWDAAGNRYLDFVSGLAVNSLGHCHPQVVEAIKAQADLLMHCSNLYHIEPQVRLAQLLVENSALDRVFFCNSGAEAVEAAIKLVRKYAKQRHGPERFEILTARNSFHGRTLAAITATGQSRYQQGFEPLLPGFRHFPFNDLEALRGAVGEHTCAVMLEPVQGEGGVNIPDRDYLHGVRRICDERGLLLVLDEVQTGIGRTGRFFAYEHYGVAPDIVTLAKALGGGFPIGAALAREKVAAAFVPGDHASTFGGNPLACATAVAAVQAILEDGFLERVRYLADHLRARLTELQDRFTVIREVRGLGLLVGLELATATGKAVLEHCRAHGLLINCIGDNVLRFLPPLTVTEAEVEAAVNILVDALAAEGTKGNEESGG
jgi:predicted acetylornithine/succinylornithine family transaminase